MQTNPWDILGRYAFNTELKEKEIDPQAADNILLAWPPILELLSKTFPNSHGIRILDFGCGTGSFCINIDSLGYEVTGIDSSVKMIESAKKHSPASIKYILGDHNQLVPKHSFNAIVSIMTFPFIANIQETIRVLTNKLAPNGVLIFAVFNPEWVKLCLQQNIYFANFDSVENPKIGWKTFGELKIPVYIRDNSEYIEMVKNLGLLKILEVNPPFTPEFIQKYPDYSPNNVSEYIILGFKKGTA